MFTLDATKRDTKESLGFLRKEGKMPAVFYGLGNKSTAITLSESEFKKVWKKAGESSAITLSTPEGKLDTLIHDVQIDPVSGTPMHVDFLVIDTKKAIQVAVQLEFVGEAPAVKNGTGTLVKVMHELEVEGLPKDLPHTITVDVSSLENTDSQILVKDLVLPAGVATMADGEEVVVAIAVQQEEKEEEAAPVDLNAIEVEKKGKKEEEGESEAAPAAEKAE